MYVSGCWNCNAGFGDGNGWKPVPTRLAPSSPSTQPSLPRQPRSVFAQLMIYVVGGSVVVALCFFGIAATAIAGSGHGAPTWVLLFLGLTQALPLLVFAITSWPVLHSIATRTRYGRSFPIWYWSVGAYLASWLVFLVAISLFARS